MAILFPELSKKSVHIGIGGGNWVDVPMLTLGDYEEFQRILADLAAFGEKNEAVPERIEMIISAHGKLADLANKVMPPELHERVRMMDYKQLSALVTCLCTGKDNGEEDAPEKKVVLPSQIKT